MAHVLTADEVDQALRTLDDWYGDPEGITRSATLSSFPEAIDVVDQVATVAESIDHHPDIDLAHRIEGVLNEV